MNTSFSRRRIVGPLLLLGLFVASGCSSGSSNGGSSSSGGTNPGGFGGPSSAEETAAIEQGKPLPATEAAMKAVVDAIGERGTRMLLDVDWADVRDEDILLDPMFRKAFDAVRAAYASAGGGGGGGGGVSGKSVVIAPLDNHGEACGASTCETMVQAAGAAVEAIAETIRKSPSAPSGARSCAVAAEGFAGSWGGFGAELGGYALATCTVRLKELAAAVTDAAGAGCTGEPAATLDRCKVDCAFIGSRIGRNVELDGSTGTCRIVDRLLVTNGKDVKSVTETGSMGPTRYSLPDDVNSMQCIRRRGLLASHSSLSPSISYRASQVNSLGTQEILALDTAGGGVFQQAQMEVAQCGDTLFYTKPSISSPTSPSAGSPSELHARHRDLGNDSVIAEEPGLISGLVCHGSHVYYGVITTTGLVAASIKRVSASTGSTHDLGSAWSTTAEEGVIQMTGALMQLAICSVGTDVNLYYSVPSKSASGPGTGPGGGGQPGPPTKAQVRRVRVQGGVPQASSSEVIAEEDNDILGLTCAVEGDANDPSEIVTYGVAMNGGVELHSFDITNGAAVKNLGQVYTGTIGGPGSIHHFDVKWCR